MWRKRSTGRTVCSTVLALWLLGLHAWGADLSAMALEMPQSPANQESESFLKQVSSSAESSGRGAMAGPDCPQSSCGADSCCLSHSADNSDEQTQVACTDKTSATPPNAFARCFDLAAEGVAGVLAIDSVTFGVSQFDSSVVGGGCPDDMNVNINVYVDFSCPPSLATAILVDTRFVTITVDDENHIINVPFGGLSILGDNFLVVEIEAPGDADRAFRPMANSSPVCADALIRAGACGLFDWAEVTTIDAATSQTVLLVSGHQSGGQTVVCGDGLLGGCEVCDPPEPDCRDGCMRSPLCGDGLCEVDEDCGTCPEDCSCLCGEVCTNGVCECPTAGCSADLNGDGEVGAFDLALLLGSWGACPEPDCQTSEECDDGDLCNGPENCAGGVCQPGPPLFCDDGNACTDDSCDPGSGCENTPIDCDDGDACTDDSCDSGGGCVNAPIDCDDGDACTDDSCDPGSGCVNAPIVPCCGNGVQEPPGEECDPPGVFCDINCQLVCSPDAGSCCAANGTPGCADEECCSTICEFVDAHCCLDQWDQGCVQSAVEFCGCSTCCIAHLGTGCDDSACENAVCQQNSACCNFAWGPGCAIIAQDLCEVCQ